MSASSFTTIIHSRRKALNLSLNEYVILDTIYNLANHPKCKVKGWCTASKSWLSNELDISKRSIIRIIGDLGKRGLIEKSEDGRLLRTLDKWNDCVIEFRGDKSSPSVTPRHQGGDKSSPKGVTKVHPDLTIIDTSINTIENRIGKRQASLIEGQSEKIQELGQMKFELLLDFLEMRKDTGKALKSRKGLSGVLSKFEEHETETLKRAVLDAISGEYQGLFPEKYTKTSPEVAPDQPHKPKIYVHQDKRAQV